MISFILAKKVVNPRKNSIKKTVNLTKKSNQYFNFDDIKKEKIKIKSYDGYILNGYVIRNEKKSKNFVIISHGHNWTKAGSLKFMDLYLKIGFNVIIYDNRGHGENENHNITMGVCESQDLIEVVSYTRRTFGWDMYLGLHGESMGASLTIMALEYKPRVQFVVCDCGYSDFSHVLKQTYKKKHYPRYLVKTTGLASHLLYGFNINKIKPINSLPGNKIPICYFHGKKDSQVPFNESILLYDKTDGYRELHLFDNSEHLMCLRDEPEKYRKLLENFFSRIHDLHYDNY